MRELHPRDKDQKVTKSKKAETAQQSPVLTFTYFYRKHSLGATCALGWQLSPKPLQTRFTVTQSELSSICPNPPIAVSPSSLSCPLHTILSRKHPLTLVSGKRHITRKWEPCNKTPPHQCRAPPMAVLRSGLSVSC